MNRGLGRSGVISILMLFACAFIMMPAPAGATPPKGIKLGYHHATQILTVTIIHDILGKRSHFIKLIEIKKNGTVVSIKTQHSQPSPLLANYQYRINAIEDDTLQIIATCSEGQSMASDVLTVVP